MSKKTYHTYKLKSYVNASHAVRWDSGVGQKHMHTWEIITEIQMKDTEELVKFNDIEAIMKELFSKLSGRFLNEIPPFDKVNPTLENLTDYLFKVLSKLLKKHHARLVRLEMGESPTRYYCVSLKDFTE